MRRNCFFECLVAAIDRQRTAHASVLVFLVLFPVSRLVVQPVALRGGSGKRIELTDLRFGKPGAGNFHCVAVEDSSGKILASWFTYGSGRISGGAIHGLTKT